MAEPALPVRRPIRLARCGVALMMLGAGWQAAADERDRIVVGAGVAVTPRFLGSDEYRVQPAPLIDVRRGRFFAHSGNGIGFNLVETPHVTAGASVSWMPGYRRGDVPDGIGKLSTALGGRVFVSGRLGGVVGTLAATQAVTHSERGLLVDARLAYPYRMNERVTLVPSVAATWANGKYMDSYFGVDAGQAARSGLERYEPSAGFRDVSLRLALDYRINADWSVVGAVGVSRLLNEAGDSPLVQRKLQPSAVLGVAYTF